MIINEAVNIKSIQLQYDGYILMIRQQKFSINLFFNSINPLSTLLPSAKLWHMTHLFVKSFPQYTQMVFVETEKAWPVGEAGILRVTCDSLPYWGECEHSPAYTPAKVSQIRDILLSFFSLV